MSQTVETKEFVNDPLRLAERFSQEYPFGEEFDLDMLNDGKTKEQIIRGLIFDRSHITADFTAQFFVDSEREFDPEEIRFALTTSALLESATIKSYIGFYEQYDKWPESLLRISHVIVGHKSDEDKLMSLYEKSAALDKLADDLLLQATPPLKEK